MAGSRLPIAVAHGEGFADFSQRGDAAKVHARCASSTTTASHRGLPVQPQRQPGGLTAVTTADGRFTALMPHPERVFRNVQMSWTGGDVSARPAPGCACSATRGGWARPGA
jgi:phosphoribosylformylglycinamidine synthase